MSGFAFAFSAEKKLVKILKSDLECHARILKPRIPPSVCGFFNVKMQEGKNLLLMSPFALEVISQFL